MRGRYSEILGEDAGLCDACRVARAKVYVNLEPVAMYVWLCGICVRSLAARYGDAAKLLTKERTRGKR